MTVIRRFDGPEQLAAAAAQYVVDLILEILEENGLCSLALAGGNTPRATYQQVASALRRSSEDLTGLQFYWGDERCVPLDDPESNYRMAAETMLEPLGVDSDQVHPIRCGKDAERGANQYELDLHKAFPDRELPRFDLVLLGLGEEGHTASLFPGSDLIAESERWVGATFVDKIDAWRVSLTPLAINAAANVAFLVQGTDKADAVRQVIAGDHDPSRWPAQAIEPADGNLYWFLDKGAARRI
ncbi:MAG: 6-phosphogluconolactonase [Anaerolineales bacterium]